MTADTATSRSLACLEIWGGNCAVQEALELPGLSAWVYSRPLHDAERGGDVYYLSACSHGLITRIALADVSGHGQGVDPLAQTLRRLMHKYVNHWDQGEFAEALNRAFRSTQEQFQDQLDALGLHGAIFATCTILGYYCEGRQLLMTNAGHMPPLHYSAMESAWRWLDEQAPFHRTKLTGLPLGLIPDTHYSQTGFQLGPQDLLVLYTDGLLEALNESGEELGFEGLMAIARALSIGAPADIGAAMLEEVHRFSAGGTRADDETLIVLQCNAS